MKLEANMSILNEHQESLWNKWPWIIMFGVTVIVALLHATILTAEVSRHNSLWYLNVIHGKGLEDRLADEMLKDWKDVSSNYRSAWILYRTPVSLYLGTLMTFLGPVCCMAARYQWHRDAWFVSLAMVTLVVTAFHLWANNPLTAPKNFMQWPFLLFPASVLIPLWFYTLIKERVHRTKTNELTTG